MSDIHEVSHNHEAYEICGFSCQSVAVPFSVDNQHVFDRLNVGEPAQVTWTDESREGTLGEVVDARVKIYGDPIDTFVRIAQVWTGILGHEVQSTDVPLMMIGMKMIRTTQAPDYSDNTDDIDGYLDIFRTLVGEDMVQARSVTEYIELKKLR